MSSVQGKNLSRFIDTDQVIFSKHVRLFLLSVLSICLIDYFLYGVFYSFNSNTFSIWLASAVVILLSFFALAYYVSVNRTAQRYLKATFASISFLTGLFLGVTTVIIHVYLIQDEPQLTNAHILTFTALLLTTSHIFALTFLTQHIRYFLLFFIPSVVPLVFLQLSQQNQDNILFYLAYYVCFLATILCAQATYKIHHRLSRALEKNTQLVDIAHQHNKWSDELCLQLQREIDKSKDIGAQLQFNNHLLEQKVRERTFDLTQMNESLQEHRQNLSFAHETAGIRPWEWNFEQRTVGLTNSQQQEIIRDSQDHFTLMHKIVHPDDLARVKNTLFQHLDGKTPRFTETFRIQRSNGEWVWIHDVGQVISRDEKSGSPLRMVGIYRDINQEKKDQDRLKLAATVFEQAAEGIFILDENLRYIESNPFYAQMSGFQRDHIIGKYLFDLVKSSKANPRMTQEEIVQQLLSKGEYHTEKNIKFRSGKELEVRMHINAVKDEQNRIINYIGILSDLTEYKLQEQRLSYLENYDPLTDLPNRLYYHQQLHQYLVNETSIQQLAVIRLNIDRFRALNELVSHHAGDEILKQVSQRLRLSNPDALLVAHLSADDFAIVYEMSPLHPPIHQLCNNVVEAFSKPFDLNDQEYFVSISVGVAIYPDHGRQVDNLNTHAEQALNEAKHLGGNTIRYYSKERANFFDKHTDLELDLRKAIQNNELFVHYQPKMNALDGKVVGFEALIRWNHPSKGLIMPNIFIPLAESTSLISDIGRFVLYEAAKQLQAWQKLGFNHINIAVNIVAQQIQRGQLLSDLDDILETYAIIGRNLVLEITESAFLENTDTVKMVLKAIKERDISIALDDFGTGYSSLAYLTEYPIDILKIDRAFISKIGNAKQDAIVNAMIAMGKTIGLKVVAEGVETEQQSEYLKHQECDILQGYLFAKPLSAKHATEFLQKHNQVTTATKFS